MRTLLALLMVITLAGCTPESPPPKPPQPVPMSAPQSSAATTNYVGETVWGIGIVHDETLLMRC
jgi:hypothetical protein